MYFGEYKNINKISEINDKDLKDLIEKCINNRISWNEYFNHKFFTKFYPDYNEDDDTDFSVLKELIDYGNTFLQYGQDMRRYLVPLTSAGKNRLNKLNEQYREWGNRKENIKELSDKLNELKKKIIPNEK